jgi:hypothetical protein
MCLNVLLPSSQIPPFLFPTLILIFYPTDTKENLDLSFALQYYTRMRFTMNLLPLLRKSPRPRVINVMNGGNEKPILTTDLGLQDPDNYSWTAAVNHTSTLTSLSFAYLASNNENKNISFMHAFPGLVRTEIFSRVKAPQSSGWVPWILTAFMSGFAGWMQWFLGMSVADCGERMAWALTGDAFRPGELWRINEKSDAVVGQGGLGPYVEEGWREKVWDFNLGVFEKALRARE